MLTAIFLVSVPGIQTDSYAGDGDPLAIRNWPGGTISIETNWGLHLVVNSKLRIQHPFSLPVDKVVQSSQHLNHTLLRKPNEAKSIWQEGSRPGTNHITVQSTAVSGVNTIAIRVDGASLVVCVPGIAPSSDEEIEGLTDIDLLVLSSAEPEELLDESAGALVKNLKPKLILLNQIQDAQSDVVSRFQASVSALPNVSSRRHNTLPVSASNMPAGASQVVVLGTRPWKMPNELEKAFAAMEKSCADSQTVFAKLSVTQMNFKPSNGTHTPRWNTEHMMGRQLLFFSQIYHAQDATIPTMNLNPKQMPPDYEYAHPDWDGKEESRQMQRVANFTRRFAYLLDGLDLNKKAPGSSWPTLQALLTQMYRHYSEHTANTVKKFDLPDFPKN